MDFTTRIWVCSAGLRKGARVEERNSNNNGCYIFVQSDGKASKINYLEAMRKVKAYSMTCVFEVADYEGGKD